MTFKWQSNIPFHTVTSFTPYSPSGLCMEQLGIMGILHHNMWRWHPTTLKNCGAGGDEWRKRLHRIIYWSPSLQPECLPKCGCDNLLFLTKHNISWHSNHTWIFCLIILSLSPLANAVDCVWSNWGSWGSCSASCGGGTQQRSRAVSQEAMNGGAACQGSPNQSQSCSDQSCPSMIVKYHNIFNWWCT